MIQDIALIDPNKLPQNSKFVDPYDNFTFLVEQNDTLSGLVFKINNRRLSLNIDTILPEHLSHYITESLYQSTKENIRPQYFKLETVNPQFSHFRKLIKTLASQWVSGEQISVKQQQERTALCLACPLHQATSRLSETANTLLSISKAAVGITTIPNFPDKEKLGKCGACGCGLQHKISFSLSAVLSELEPEEIDKILVLYNSFEGLSRCWMLKESVESPLFRTAIINKLKYINKDKYYTDYQKSKNNPL